MIMCAAACWPTDVHARLASALRQSNRICKNTFRPYIATTVLHYYTIFYAIINDSFEYDADNAYFNCETPTCTRDWHKYANMHAN